MNHPADETNAAAEQRWLEVVREKVRAIRFGSVLVTVHEGRVTQGLPSNEQRSLSQLT
jgi:hypothetical protein